MRCSSPTRIRCARTASPRCEPRVVLRKVSRWRRQRRSHPAVLSWSSDDGFSVKDYFAVEQGYGTWDDITLLGRRFDLMFDAVSTTCPPRRLVSAIPPRRAGVPRFLRTVEGNPTLACRPATRAAAVDEFPTARGPERVWTTFSADQVDVNVKNRGAAGVGDALLFYVAHGARFIRLDAIAYLWKEIARRASICRRPTRSSNSCAPCWTRLRRTFNSSPKRTCRTRTTSRIWRRNERGAARL